MTKRILIIGATSAIAQAVAKRYCKSNAKFFLVARDAAHLTLVKKDLIARGAQIVGEQATDFTEHAKHPHLIAQAMQALGGMDIVLMAHGSLSAQKPCEQSVAMTMKELDINLLSAISLLTLLASEFERQQHGTIAVISSVAGDVGRASNYVYGAAKAGLSAFLQGLRNRLYKANVNVLTIKPGYVDTPMIQHLKRSFIWAKPDTVARDIERAIDKRKEVLYTPWFWRLIMLLIKFTPEKIAKKLSW